jgi:hypothetical protein
MPLGDWGKRDLHCSAVCSQRSSLLRWHPTNRFVWLGLARLVCDFRSYVAVALPYLLVPAFLCARPAPHGHHKRTTRARQVDDQKKKGKGGVVSPAAQPHRHNRAKLSLPLQLPARFRDRGSMPRPFIRSLGSCFSSTRVWFSSSQPHHATMDPYRQYRL